MLDLLQHIPPALQEHARKEAFPRWSDPMLATLTNAPFSDPDWIFERKLDGERIIAYCRGGAPGLMTRNRKPANNTYPEIAEKLANQNLDDCILDGEVVAFKGRRTSFARLQQRLQIKDAGEARASGVAVYYYLFDVLYAAGRDLCGLPLRHRKSLLKQAIAFDDPIRYTPHRNETGESYFQQACGKGWEGLIAKRASASYQHKRSRDWLKLKCTRRQELVIAGYTDPEGARVGFGALLLGYYEDGSLRYAGKVGTGFDQASLQRLKNEMDNLSLSSTPFAHPVKEPGVHWVRPKLVAEIGFTEWTADRKLRHPRFLGLRRDKSAEQVTRETVEAENG